MPIDKIIIFSLSILLLFNNKNKDSKSSTFVFNTPLVSIIIPVHNKMKYTYYCIKSILAAENSLSYEIIISNDMSTDNTKMLKGKRFKNINNLFIYNNDKKYGFLSNCNKAVKKARGKYILFLNNDTKVHKEWLTFLLKLIEGDEKIGMVGSKLIYPNGTLQEAGGIIWKNGDGWNFGRGQNASMPEYNYVKEVDYISGASILIRRNIWDKIGGFDERFIPAYYEDTDFAFELRKYGYKVMYQPLSIVEHYEGISNGKNIISDIKQYQEINRIKFIEKWKEELKNQFDAPFMARDRCYNKSRIFVIDRFVPNFDKDAGGRCCFMYLNLFKEIGLQVTFLGNDFQKIEPYTTILQQKGIEVLYGDKDKDEKLEIWFKENLKYFKFVYLQRPDIGQKYIDSIRKYFLGKIFYFAHDLHHVRLAREYNITNNTDKLRESEIVKNMEFDIFNKVDVIHVVGDFEYKYLKNEFKNKTIRNIPLFIYKEQYNNIEKDFSKRNDLILVAGLLHFPNYDGVIWFSKEVYPKILMRFPNMIWHIVGSGIPEDIKRFESKNIKIEGFLNDKDLHLLYQKCRIALAPLRFGAGVKGKIVEAAHNQIPMVTTSIGGEGLDNSIGAFIVEDNPDKMANIICKLYEDYSKLKQMSDAGIILIEKYFSVNKAKKILLKDFDKRDI